MFADHFFKQKFASSESTPANAADSPMPNAADSPAQSPMPTEIQWMLMVAEALIEGMALGAILLVVLACSIPTIAASLLWGTSAVAAALGAAAILVAVGFCRKNRQIDGLKNATAQANAGKEPESIAEHSQVEYDEIVQKNKTLKMQIDALKKQKSEVAHTQADEATQILKSEATQIQADEAAHMPNEQLGKSQLQGDDLEKELEAELETENTNRDILQADLKHTTKIASWLLQGQIALRKNIQDQIEQFQKSLATSKNMSLFDKLRAGKLLSKNKDSPEEKIDFLNSLQAKLNDSKSSEMDTKSKFVCQFFDPDYDMFAFIGQLAPESLGKILGALASPNYEAAMAVLLHSKEMGAQISDDFFDYLSLREPANCILSSLNVKDIVREYIDTTNGKLRQANIAAMESREIGSEFFSSDEDFTKNLDDISTLLRQFDLFGDFERECENFEVIINGKKCDDLASWKRQCNECGSVTESFLRELKNSGLPPEDALKALKSIYLIKWIQGGSAAIVLAVKEKYENESMPRISDPDVVGFVCDQAKIQPCYKIKIEIQSTGNVRMSMINTDIMKTCLPGMGKCHYYFFGHMIIECDPEGNNHVVDATTIMDMF
ncbi:MAG: hypothetical protein LBI69_00150 [Puniceicoccales bacterium]|jgi:hypothetical protein|nr:hypothetical protein [Puniceicoccales bacterium]